MGVGVGAVDPGGVNPHLLTVYAEISVPADVTAGVPTAANAVLNWSTEVADCTAVLAWSNAVLSVWNAEAMSLGAWLSRLSKALASVEMSCFSAVRSGWSHPGSSGPAPSRGPRSW